jgi:non-specific serine/threonine protein kinase
LRFGPAGRFLLEPAERRLWVDGQTAALGARALDLLLVLAAQPGHLLTKSELLERVWPGLIVEEGNLQVQISNLRKVLGGEAIVTVPGRGYRFAGAVEAVTTTAAPAAPQLVGRSTELAQLQALWQRAPCVTLVGPAGVGKTSLARAAVLRWPGRSVWVDLAALGAGEPVASVAAALGRALGKPLEADPLPTLRRALQGEPLLVVLDNAEHVVQACAELLAALKDLAAPRWLVTSQLPLALGHEQVLRLAPLSQEGALALLSERVAAADRRLQAEPESLPLRHEICARLDGLPLAIEMAAARVPLLGWQGVRDALDQRFALLTRGLRDAAERHRTLHHALAWSYQLLAPEEQGLLRQLAVFAGGFTLELAVALAAAEPAARWDLIDHLAALVDRSLVVAGPEDPPRYRLLETVRAFGLEQLAAAGEEAATRGRHALALQALLVSATPGDAATAALCLAEMENIRAAWDWAQTRDLALAARLSERAAALTTFSPWRLECARWLRSLEPALQSSAGAALPLSLRTAWWQQLARVLVIGREARAPGVAQQAVALAREQGDALLTLRALGTWVRAFEQAGAELDEATDALQAGLAALPGLGPRDRLLAQGALNHAAAVRGDLQAGLEGREAEARLAQQLGLQAVADAAESNALNMLGGLGRYDEARVRGQALLARVDAAGGATESNLPWVLNVLMHTCIQLGRLDEAAALVPRAHAVRLRFDVPLLAMRLPVLADAARRHEAAARLLGHARATLAARGELMETVDHLSLQPVEQRAVAALGRERVDELLHEGRLLDEAAAAALAVAAVDGKP